MEPILLLLGGAFFNFALAAVTPREVSSIVPRNPTDEMCGNIPIPTSDSIPAVCRIALSGAKCKACSIQWASANICNCYDNNSDCNAARQSAVDCDIACSGKCGQESPQKTFRSKSEICNIARSGSVYKECDTLVAHCNIWNCYGSVYYTTQYANAQSIFCRYAAKCAEDCARNGNCTMR